MQVNVFITRKDGQLQNKLLVLPYGTESEIPARLQRYTWSNFAISNTNDKLLHGAKLDIEMQINAVGYALIDATTDI